MTELAKSAPSRRSMRGQLRLCASPGGDSRTVLSDQFFCAPIHLSKPYWEGTTLHAFVASQTPGLLEGDGIDVDVNVCSGAHLVLSNPSATRAHTMANGHAMVSQQFAIEQGARLEWLPGMLIPQRDAELRQQSAFRVAQGGGLLAIEMIAPGRVAHRETFDFRHLRLGCDIVVSDVLTVRERNSLTPASALEAGWKRFPKGCVATIYAVDPAIEKRLATNIMGFHSIECWVGASIVAQSNLLAVRILSDSMRSCRRLTAMIRKEILASCGWPISEARNASDDSYGQRD